jgi:hypothetical protein
MCAKAAITTARLLLGATTIICTLFAGSVAAEDKMVTDSIRISPQGLDLTQRRMRRPSTRVWRMRRG